MQHSNYQSRKFRHNYSDAKWTPEEEDIIMQSIGLESSDRQAFFADKMSEFKSKLNKPMVLHFSEVKTPPMVLTN